MMAKHFQRKHTYFVVTYNTLALEHFIQSNEPQSLNKVMAVEYVRWGKEVGVDPSYVDCERGSL